jgi:hypothetical protein
MALPILSTGSSRGMWVRFAKPLKLDGKPLEVRIGSK